MLIAGILIVANYKNISNTWQLHTKYAYMCTVYPCSILYSHNFLICVLCVCLCVCEYEGGYVSQHPCGGQRTMWDVNVSFLLYLIEHLLLFTTVHTRLVGFRESPISNSHLIEGVLGLQRHTLLAFIRMLVI